MVVLLVEWQICHNFYIDIYFKQYIDIRFWIESIHIHCVSKKFHIARACRMCMSTSYNKKKEKNTRSTTIRNHSYKKDGAASACQIGGVVVHPKLSTLENLDKDIMRLMKIDTFDHMEHNQLIYHYFIRTFCEQANTMTKTFSRYIINTFY
jgi:hypothetical protein